MPTDALVYVLVYGPVYGFRTWSAGVNKKARINPHVCTRVKHRTANSYGLVHQAAVLGSVSRFPVVHRKRTPGLPAGSRLESPVAPVEPERGAFTGGLVAMGFPGKAGCSGSGAGSKVRGVYGLGAVESGFGKLATMPEIVRR
jgi:hypothetical protein